MIINRQSEVRVDLGKARKFASKLRSTLRLRDRKFNVCFVSDPEIRNLNAVYRGKPVPTDVLSFPWQEGKGKRKGTSSVGFAKFLGDIAISARSARRNARAEGHSTQTEISWLILHGVLHLLGYNHETDSGEMTALEFSLREKLDGLGRSRRKRRVRKQGTHRRSARNKNRRRK